MICNLKVIVFTLKSFVHFGIDICKEGVLPCAGLSQSHPGENISSAEMAQLSQQFSTLPMYLQIW